MQEPCPPCYCLYVLCPPRLCFVSDSNQTVKSLLVENSLSGLAGWRLAVAGRVAVRLTLTLRLARARADRTGHDRLGQRTGTAPTGASVSIFLSNCTARGENTTDDTISITTSGSTVIDGYILYRATDRDVRFRPMNSAQHAVLVLAVVSSVYVERRSTVVSTVVSRPATQWLCWCALCITTADRQPTGLVECRLGRRRLRAAYTYQPCCCGGSHCDWHVCSL